MCVSHLCAPGRTVGAAGQSRAGWTEGGHLLCAATGSECSRGHEAARLGPRACLTPCGQSPGACLSWGWDKGWPQPQWGTGPPGWHWTTASGKGTVTRLVKAGERGGRCRNNSIGCSPRLLRATLSAEEPVRWGCASVHQAQAAGSGRGAAVGSGELGPGWQSLAAGPGGALGPRSGGACADTQAARVRWAPDSPGEGALCGLGLCSRGPTGCLTFREHLGPWRPLLQTSWAGDPAVGWGLSIEGLSKPWPQTSSSAVLGAGSSCLDSRHLRLGQSLNAGCRATLSRPQDDG